MPIIHSQNQVDGQEVNIYIQVDTIPPSEGGFRDGPTEKALKITQDLFRKGLDLSRDCAVEVIDSIKQMKDTVKPDEFEVKLAIKLDSGAGVPYLVKLGAEAQMEVTMKWTPKKHLNKQND
ncbi:MAG: CU044_2847 family protein [Nostoc sp.]|uniref:CU044_2847 family protein n=1 Tax=Nostoc sp. TaxID=1180 RepID=UPI002FF0168E